MTDLLKRLADNRALCVHFAKNHANQPVVVVFVKGIESPIMKFSHINEELNYAAAVAAVKTFPRHTNAGEDDE